MDIAVICFPRLSNFSDLDPLSRESDVVTRFVRLPADLRSEPDALILPGSVNTAESLWTLRRSGLGRAILDLVRRGVPVVGVGGGFAMLGQVLSDSCCGESRVQALPLGLLPVATVVAAPKRASRATAVWLASAREIPWGAGLGKAQLVGYRIHAGEVRYLEGQRPLLAIRDGQCVGPDGAATLDGQVWGTYLHGIFANSALTRRWLNYLRRRRGWEPLPLPESAADTNCDPALAEAFARLADHVRAHLDIGAIYRLIGL